MNRPVALAGVSGAGKSTVGPRLAARLGVPFVDVDARVVEVEGRTIPEVFAQDGEKAFRAVEARLTLAELARGAVVVALGGGAPMTPAVREALAGADVVWLRVDPSAAAERTGADPNRPLLAGRPAQDALAELLARRAPTYAAVATWVVDTDGRAPDDIVEEIAALIEGGNA